MGEIASTKSQKFHLLPNLLLVLAAVLSLIIANSALWFNRYIFDNDNFTQIATSAITSESSRDAIATEIVDETLQDRPLLRNVVQEPATKLISGLLGTRLATGVIDRAVSRLQTISTSQNPESVEIDLSGLKETIVGVSNLLQVSGRVEEGRQVDVNSIPDKIMLLDASDIPNIYQIGITLLWVGPVTFISAVILLLIPIFRNWKNKESLSLWLTLQGFGLLLASGLALVLGPLFKPQILSGVGSRNLRVVVGNIYDAFIQKFNEQTFLILIAGVVLLVAAFANYWFGVKSTEVTRG